MEELSLNIQMQGGIKSLKRERKKEEKMGDSAKRKHYVSLNISSDYKLTAFLHNVNVCIDHVDGKFLKM